MTIPRKIYKILQISPCTKDEFLVSPLANHIGYHSIKSVGSVLEIEMFSGQPDQDTLAYLSLLVEIGCLDYFTITKDIELI